MSSSEAFYKIGGLTFRICVRGFDAASINSKLYGKFEVKLQDPIDFGFTVYQDKLPDVSNYPVAFDSESLWKLYRIDGDFVFNTLIDYALIVRQGFQTAEYVYKDPSFLKDVPIRHMDQLAFLHHLMFKQSVLIHSSGVGLDGAGYLFVGYSEAGKSTLSELFNTHQPGTTVLSDERIIVRQQDVFRMHGTPWHGTYPVMDAGNVPIKAIYVLRHGERNQLTPLSPTKAAAELLVRTFAPHWYAPGLAATLETLDRLVQSVPVYDFAFVPDASAVEHLLSCSL